MNLAALMALLPDAWRSGFLRLFAFGLGAALIFAAGYATAWMDGRDAARLREAEGLLAAERIAHEITQADLKAASRARALSDEQVTADRAEAATLQNRIDAYETRLAAMVRPACSFDRGDVADLLRIRGDGPATGFSPAQADSGSARHPGTGAAAAPGVSDCRRYAARMTAAARLANERLIAGRNAWIDLQKTYAEPKK